MFGDREGAFRVEDGRVEREVQCSVGDHLFQCVIRIFRFRRDLRKDGGSGAQDGEQVVPIGDECAEGGSAQDAEIRLEVVQIFFRDRNVAEFVGVVGIFVVEQVVDVLAVAVQVEFFLAFDVVMFGDREGAFRIEDGRVKRKVQHAVGDHLFDLFVRIGRSGRDLEVFFRRSVAVIVVCVVQFVIARDVGGGGAVLHIRGEYALHRPNVIFRCDLLAVFPRRVEVEGDLPSLAVGGVFGVRLRDAVTVDVFVRHVDGVARRHLVDEGVGGTVLAQREVIQTDLRVPLHIGVRVGRAVMGVPGRGRLRDILSVGMQVVSRSVVAARGEHRQNKRRPEENSHQHGADPFESVRAFHKNLRTKISAAVRDAGLLSPVRSRPNAAAVYLFCSIRL